MPAVWSFRSSGRDEHAVLSAHSNVWPGAVAVAKANKAESACLYIGYGQRFLPTLYSPPPPPVIQSEYISKFNVSIVLCLYTSFVVFILLIPCLLFAGNGMRSQFYSHVGMSQADEDEADPIKEQVDPLPPADFDDKQQEADPEKKDGDEGDEGDAEEEEED